MTDLIQRLRASAKGRYYWYCQHKIDKGINMSFEDYERHEAHEWFKERLSRHPDYYRNYEMVRVHVLDQTDKLMLDAADALETLSTQASEATHSVLTRSMGSHDANRSLGSMDVDNSSVPTSGNHQLCETET